MNKKDVFVHTFDLRERTINTGSDNTPTIYWQRKGSTTTTKNPAELLRIQALHQRHHCYCSLFSHIPGPINAMADDTSRLWNLSDSQLLAYFNATYPQQLPWRLCRLHPETKSALISACCGQPSMPASFLLAPAHRIASGPSGRTSVMPLAPTPPSHPSMTPSCSSKSLANATVMAVSPPATGRSGLALWRTPSMQSARALPDWGPGPSPQFHRWHRLPPPMPTSWLLPCRPTPLPGQAHPHLRDPPCPHHGGALRCP